MPLFHFNIAPIKRSMGQQATGAAAYRAGERIRDERTGKVHNYSKRQDVRHKEILLPSRFGEAPMEWARDRVSLWNAAEAAENRRNSRVAREFRVTLPSELDPEQRVSLARSFAREVADRYGVAVDLAIHDPKPGSDPRNFHAHLLATTREVTETGLGAKAGLDMRSVSRAQQGLTPHAEEYSIMRERWATLTNGAFREANLPLRVDHRTLEAQGIDRRPLVRIPAEFFQLERQGVPKEAAERLRAEYRARIAAYQERSRLERELKQHERSLSSPAGAPQEAVRGPHGSKQQERSPGEHAGLERAPLTREKETPSHQPPSLEAQLSTPQHATPAQALSRDEHAAPPTQSIAPRDAAGIRRRAVQEWLQMRSKEAKRSEASNDMGKQPANERGREDGRER
jgi:hypothetical protein